MMSALASASRFASSALFDFLNGLILSRKLSPSPAARGRSTRRAEWRGVLGYAGHPCVTTRSRGRRAPRGGGRGPDLDAGQARGVGASQHLDVARQVSCGVPRTERACDARAGRDEAHGALCAFHLPRGGRVSQRICVLRSIGPTKISCSDSCLCVTTRTRHSAPLRGKSKWVRPRALDAAHTTRRTFSDLETPRLSRRAPIGKGRVCTFGEARRIDPQFVRPPPRGPIRRISARKHSCGVPDRSGPRFRWPRRTTPPAPRTRSRRSRIGARMRTTTRCLRCPTWVGRTTTKTSSRR